MGSSGLLSRYRPLTPLVLRDRTWPDKVPTSAPRWLSTDLRDGNQALAEPMTPERKLAMFELLVGMGYTEIEVGFPAASQDDHLFVRDLIERDLVPDNVRISVMVPAREELIRHTVRALEGAHKASLHLYNATSPTFRNLVFGMTRDECRDLAVRGTRLVMKYSDQALADVDLGFQYSPELFNETEPEFALEVCEAVMDEWQPGPGREIILNFPATVERTQPNVFADQIEWIDRHLSRREHVCLSVHPHNDRGTGVACAELARLAGAQRVEGCLFGGGERAGNVCLITLGLNLLTQGIDPGVDFSDLDRIRRTVEYCNRSEVPERHPYAGDLVYTAFSGAHQDAIKKGFDAMAREAARTGRSARDLRWSVPYLPLDPADVGRDYEAVVRITSQSGKSGVAYVLGVWHGFHPPRALQIEFAGHVQAVAEARGTEIAPEEIGSLFRREYLSAADPEQPPFTPLLEPVIADLYFDVPPDEGSPDDGAPGGGSSKAPGLRGEAVDSVAESLAPHGVEVASVARTGSVSALRDPGRPVVVYARCRLDGGGFWGVGQDPDSHAAALAAVRAAVVRSGADLSGKRTGR